MKHPFSSTSFLLPVMAMLMSACNLNSNSNCIKVTIEMDKNTSPIQAFINCQYLFYSKFMDPSYEAYPSSHWETIDSSITKDNIKITKTSNCEINNIDNEYYKHFNNCIHKQIKVVSKTLNKTISLEVYTEKGKDKLDYYYDKNAIIQTIRDSAEQRSYKFHYFKNELQNIDEVDLNKDQNLAIIKFHIK